MPRNFDKQLLLGAGLLAAVLVVFAGIGYRNAWHLRDGADQVAHSNEVLDALDDLLSTMKDAETGQRGFVITGDERYLKPYDDARATIQQKIERLQQLTGDNSQQQARIPRLREIVQAKLDE